MTTYKSKAVPVKKGAAASRWLRAVQPLLSSRLGGALKLATQLTEFLNEDVFADSGRLVGWQGIQGLSEATRLCERAVQKNLRRLEKLHVVEPTISRGGRTKTNCYELKMPPGHADQAAAAAEVETPHAGTGFNDQKPRTPVQGLSGKTPHSQVRNPALAGQKTPYAGSPELLKNYKEPSRAREPRGHKGLGSTLCAKLRARIGDDDFRAWFAKGEAGIVEETADTIVIAVRDKSFAEQIQTRFASDLVACSGVPRVELVVRQS